MSTALDVVAERLFLYQVAPVELQERVSNDYAKAFSTCLLDKQGVVILVNEDDCISAISAACLRIFIYEVTGQPASIVPVSLIPSSALQEAIQDKYLELEDKLVFIIGFQFDLEVLKSLEDKQVAQTYWTSTMEKKLKTPDFSCLEKPESFFPLLSTQAESSMLFKLITDSAVHLEINRRLSVILDDLARLGSWLSDADLAQSLQHLSTGKLAYSIFGLISEHLENRKHFNDVIFQVTSWSTLINYFLDLCGKVERSKINLNEVFFTQITSSRLNRSIVGMTRRAKLVTEQHKAAFLMERRLPAYLFDDPELSYVFLCTFRPNGNILLTMIPGRYADPSILDDRFTVVRHRRISLLEINQQQFTSLLSKPMLFI